MDNQKIKERQQQILDRIKPFCNEKLDDEYFEMAERLITKLARKRNSPLDAGRVEVWAAAIVHAIGTINFLFDKASQPYATVDDINDFFKTNKSTSSGKSRQIREMLNLGYWDDEFSIQRMRDSNPFNKLVFMNGFLVPLDSLPHEYREMVQHARRE